ncbi:hypothetical protein ACP26L_36005 (plasmid) [Paenibacillus sp. S-38]|uniref:hypothetical protein n=1 Tax=Paenibacillus sp. S-38 TaxID=3416710 RepID=UPI003CEA7339
MNHTIKAEQRARRFFRRPPASFPTLTGRCSTIQEASNQALFFQTAKGRRNRISRTGIVKAIAYMMERRSVTRKEMEKFSRFSSALLALLRLIFIDIIRIRITKTGLIRLSLKGTRFVFSGVDRAPRDMRVARENGAEVVMMSYYHLREDHSERWKYHVKENGLKVLLDSGAFSLWEAAAKGRIVKPILLEEYISFVKRHLDVLIGYFNLDVIGDLYASRANMQAMEAAGLSPHEVWHVCSPLEELNRIVDKGAALVGIGGSALLKDGERLPRIDEALRRHPEQDFHLLGVGSKILFQLDGVFSTDATNWIEGRKSGRLLTPDGQKPMGHLLDGLEIMARNVRLLVGMAAQ